MVNNDFFSEKQLRNIDFFQKNLATYLEDKKLQEKFVVICNEELKGFYDTFSLALEYATKNFPKNEFIIQQVVDKRNIVNFIRSAVY